MDNLLGLLETGATLGSGALSGLLGMPYGLYKGVTSGAYGTPLANRIAEEEARKFMERNTYIPRTQAGQENLQAIAGLLEKSKLPPVMPEISLLGQIPRQAYAAQAERAGMAAERALEPVVQRTLERGGKGAQLLQDLSQGSISPMDVWHGSPHGPFTSFDRTKIGSGEGAQAYGYGHYTGEARGTGEGYRTALTGNQYGDKIIPTVDGKPVDTPVLRNLIRNGQSPEDFIASMQNKLESQKAALSKASKEEVLPGVSDYDMAEMALGETKKLVDEAKSYIGKEIKAESPGYLYKVDLPDEAIAQMLDWDKPVSKQPTVMTALRSEAEQRVRDRKLGEIENEIRASLPKQEVPSDYMAMFSDANAVQNQEVQAKALSKLNKMDLKELVDKELDSMKPADMNWNMTGKEFYELLARRSGGAPKASEIMQKQGVTGIRYLDQGSRNPGGSDTSNFVVFPGNEDLLRILEINDKPIGGLLGAAEPKAFDVTRRDASDIFGAGAERVKYTDPKSGGVMEVLAKPDGSASVISLEVPESFRGKGIGQNLQAQVMQDFPEMMGQVSSKAAAKTAYRLGRRPPGQPGATLDDVYKLMEENSSVNLVSPEMQKRFLGLLE